MNMRKLVVIIYSLVLLFAGCDDLEDKPYTCLLYTSDAADEL